MMDSKTPVCQWFFEEPAVDGKTVCQSCIDSAKSAEKENKDFDLDKWLEEDEKC